MENKEPFCPMYKEKRVRCRREDCAWWAGEVKSCVVLAGWHLAYQIFAQIIRKPVEEELVNKVDDVMEKVIKFLERNAVPKGVKQTRFKKEEEDVTNNDERKGE